MKKYLVCDIDDCLIKTDILYEQWLVLLKVKPLKWMLSFFWLLQGKAYLKYKLSQETILIPNLLPYRDSVLEYLKKRSAQGDILILASASPLPWVESVSNHLGLFAGCLGSTPQRNLKGAEKLAALREYLRDADFSYVGDSRADLHVWAGAKAVIAVNVSPKLKASITQLGKETEYLDDPKSNLLHLLTKQLRPHQWIKNTLVFLPALAGHQFHDPQTLFQGFVAFVGFSLSASFVYILNDLLDLPSDRNHHSKKNRPFASGDLPLLWGLAMLPILFLSVLALSILLPVNYFLWIMTYLVLNLAYSLYLKQSVVIDIIVLSFMYTLRIFAGSSATEVVISEWMLSFSTLFFFSLACIKRYTEIIRSKNKITLDGRGYRQMDHPMVQNLGVGTGLLSIMIVLLYLQSQDVRELYSTPTNLWFATPVLLFWVSRIWILTNRDEVHDDPVIFAVKDKVSWICLGILVIIFGISV